MKPIVLTLVINPENKELTFLTTEVKDEHLKDVIMVLRGLEDQLFAQMTEAKSE